MPGDEGSRGIALAADPRVFAERGYVVLRRLLDTGRVEELIQHLERFSGRRRADWTSGERGQSRPRGWTLADGVTKRREFWPLIVEPRLLAAVRAVFGPDARFLQHTDLHVGFSSFNWHRDSVSRVSGEGSDWDDAGEYQLARIGIYLQSQAGGFRLGLIPGTHRAPPRGTERERRRVESVTRARGHIWRALSGRNLTPPGAEWVSLGSGDAVMFDPRVIHTGSPVDGPKYSVFLAFGVPNHHFAAHAYYYRRLRPELGYEDPPDELVTMLREAGLFCAPVPPDRPLEGVKHPGGPLERLALSLPARRRTRPS